MKFRSFTVSSLGYKHKVAALMCQDSSDKLDFDGVQLIAVADGHGSADCFRSQIGSELAIKIILEQTKLACENLTYTFSNTGINNFKFAVYNEWRKAVRQDWYDRAANTSALGEGEIRYKSVSDKYKARYTAEQDTLEKYLYTAYGTTLIAAISIGTQILILQIGDGTCVTLRRDGDFCVPVPPDENNFLNVTTSLCEPDANFKMRHVILDCNANNPVAPVAVFLSTDGLDDCYFYNNNEQYLYNFYANVLIDNMLNNGYEDTEIEIVDSLLPGMSKLGSKDDISLAYFVPEDISVLKTTFDKIAAVYKNDQFSDAELNSMDDNCV